MRSLAIETGQGGSARDAFDELRTLALSMGSDDELVGWWVGGLVGIMMMSRAVSGWWVGKARSFILHLVQRFVLVRCRFSLNLCCFSRFMRGNEKIVLGWLQTCEM